MMPQLRGEVFGSHGERSEPWFFTVKQNACASQKALTVASQMDLGSPSVTITVWLPAHPQGVLGQPGQGQTIVCVTLR